MKKIVLLILLFSAIGYAQDKLLDILPLKHSKVNYQKVIEVKGATEEALINRANHWILSSNIYKENAEQVRGNIEEIYSRGFITELWGPNDYKNFYMKITHRILIKIKADRYQYEITNFMVIDDETEIQLELYKRKSKKHQRHNKVFYQHIDASINKVISSLEKAMTVKSIVKK